MAPTTPREDVAAQLRDLERQGGGMARLAHICAGLLLVAFSLGSLISISHAAFVAFLAEANAGRLDIPDGISLLVNILLILACDIGLLYAASVLRVLNASEAPAREKRSHKWAMWGASILESSTYLYLAWIFDRPATLFLWLLMIARAVAAPLFASYLSMARPLPVGPGDVAYHASLASGKGVVHDVATLAADPDAPLSHKVRIYRAAARMAPADRTRFDAIVEAVSYREPEDAPAVCLEEDAPTRPPTGGGSPTLAPVHTPRRKAAPVLRLEPPLERAGSVAAEAALQQAAPRSHSVTVRTAGKSSGKSTRKGSRKASNVSATERRQAAALKRSERLAQLEAWLAEDPTAGTRELTRRLAAAEGSRVSESTVAGLRRELEAAQYAAPVMSDTGAFAQ